MRHLSREKFENSIEFIRNNGRDLEGALAARYFGDGNSQSVCDVLAGYQNEDGGFGHGLEQDFLLPGSSPMATTIALQILAALEVGSDHRLIVDALNYLANARDESYGAWYSTPESVNDFPHAPWWHYDKEKMSVDDLILNPGAEIVGYFFHWSNDCDAPVDQWLDRVLLTCETKGLIEPHEFLCCHRLVSARGLPEKSRQRLTEWLITNVDNAVQTDPAKWDDYCIKPLNAAPRPGMVLSPALEKAVRSQIDFELERQNQDGSWRPHWTWFGNFSDDWARIEPQIAAAITLSMLGSLRAWGCPLESGDWTVL